MRTISLRHTPLLLGIVLALLVSGSVGLQPVALAAPDTPNTPTALCRYGVDGDLKSYAVSSLRAGWYVNWGALLSPSRPGGMSYFQMVRMSPTASGSYTYTPSGTSLAATIAANPGSTWVIGNEPDRRDLQDSLEPAVYAEAYHELYIKIKTMDSSAKIAAGSIVQPSPLRLQYLDMVLQAYRAKYGRAMPVDIWNIHAFILNEQKDEWGADIPPGIDATEGMVLTVDDNDNLTIFKKFIVDFRQWMADNGYQDRPLIITEFGVQMPADYGFTTTRVNTYMNSTFSYLASATSTSTGYPKDNYHLVQRWAWYSLDDTNYNGWLFNPNTSAMTDFGSNYAALTGAASTTVDLAPTQIAKGLEPPDQTGATATLPLYAYVRNDGDGAVSGSITVRFYDGDPTQGGQQIGEDQTISGLGGCQAQSRVQVTWTNATQGKHTIYVVVDPANSIAESNEANNTLSQTLIVNGLKQYLPMTQNQ